MNFEIDIKSRVKVLKKILKNEEFRTDFIQLNGFTLNFPKISERKNRTKYLIKPPFVYKGRKKYNHYFDYQYFDFYKGSNFYSLINVPDFQSDWQELIEEFSCTIQYTYIYIFIRDILEYFISEGYRLEIKDEVYHPLLKDLESENADIFIRLNWYPKECNVNDNILNLSIFNNI